MDGERRTERADAQEQCAPAKDTNMFSGVETRQHQTFDVSVACGEKGGSMPLVPASRTGRRRELIAPAVNYPGEKNGEWHGGQRARATATVAILARSR